MTKIRNVFMSMAAATVGLLLLGLPALAQTPQPPPIVPAAAPTAAPPAEDDRRVLRGDRTISGSNFTLRSNETLRGDLTILGGNVTLEERSRVEGDVNVFGGNADVAGTVTGKVQVVGGNVDLRSSANVEGDIVKVGGQVNRDPGAVVGGRETTMDLPFIPGMRVGQDSDIESRLSMRDRNGGPLGWLFGIITSAIFGVIGVVLITVIALGVVALFPAQVAQATSVATSNWLLSGGVGLLTMLAVFILSVLFIVTLCLSPIGLLASLLLFLGVLAGWAISARIVGERIMLAFNRRNWSVIAQTFTGAVLLAVLGNVPLIGWLIGPLAGALGLGALVLTRAGTQPYPLAPVRAMMPDPYVPPASVDVNPFIDPSAEPPTQPNSGDEPPPAPDAPRQS